MDKDNPIIEQHIANSVVTIATGQGVISQYQVLAQKSADGKWYKYDKDADPVDGTEIPRRIFIEEEVDTTAGDIEGLTLRGGILREDAVVGIDIATDFSGVAKLESFGIFIDK